MTQHGGHNVFGSWSDWGCPFDLRHLQQHWQDQAWRDLNIDESGPWDTNFQFRPTCATLTETVNLDDLTRYAALETDRRLPLLRSYLRRHASEGEQHGSMSSLKVEYYQAPTYGRLIARGPAGQKLTREAREIAFHGSYGEIDAPCCHPRLLRLQLQSLGLWDLQKYCLLNMFCENYQAWRQVVAKYLEIDIKQAKVELIRIFYGGNPRCDIPWVRKLAHEVQTAATSILGHETSSKWLAHYADRANPEFSRLCSILSFMESDLLDVIRLRTDVRLDVAIFDGGFVRTSTLLDEIALKEACQICQEKFIPMEIKGFSSDVMSFTHGLFRHGLAEAQLSDLLVVDCGNCLLNALASLGLDPACFCIDDVFGAETNMV